MTGVDHGKYARGQEASAPGGPEATRWVIASHAARLLGEHRSGSSVHSYILGWQVNCLCVSILINSIDRCSLVCLLEGKPSSDEPDHVPIGFGDGVKRDAPNFRRFACPPFRHVSPMG